MIKPAISSLEISDDMAAAPYGKRFLAENRFGDWLVVHRFDPGKPGDYSAGAVVHPRTGRWWHGTRWRLVDPASPAVEYGDVAS